MAEQPPIGDYALLSDCHTAALVSSSGSIDWCCMPRFDDGSMFGRLLDWERGGHCSVAPVDERRTPFRDYLDRTLVLETTFRVEGGEARLLDCLLAPPSETRDERRRLLRVVEGRRGTVRFAIEVMPRFDYGEVEPWLRHHGSGVFSATGGDDGLLVWSDAELEADGAGLRGEVTVRPGERARLLIAYMRPEQVDAGAWVLPEPGELDRRLEDTVAWWRDWAGRLRVDGSDAPGVVRSALVLKALAYAPTGAIVAAPTTSLPETWAGERNWDYRYSWIRDSALAARSLARLGAEPEADAFRRFVERSTAGGANDLRIAYGIGGERRLTELEVGHLAGYRGARPVRVGNAASLQRQLDAYGHLVTQSWRWYRRGNPPDDDYWRFLLALVDTAIETWREPDAGIWELRGEPRHFVHSKVLAWAAVDRGLRLAEECMRKAPERRWREARDEMRATIERDGYDDDRGVFVQAFGAPDLDAALLRLPVYGFVDFRDERMVRTADAIVDELATGDGLLRRYRSDDALPGAEGTFLCCSFWLAEVLARQERHEEARAVFDRALATANGVGLFAEEYDAERGEMAGNFPQALTHLAHVEAALALAEHGSPVPSGGGMSRG